MRDGLMPRLRSLNSSDFECPFCRRALPALEQIDETMMAIKIRVVFRQFPLNNIHPRAQKAAEASPSCAHDRRARS